MRNRMRAWSPSPRIANTAPSKSRRFRGVGAFPSNHPRDTLRSPPCRAARMDRDVAILGRHLPTQVTPTWRSFRRCERPTGDVGLTARHGRAWPPASLDVVFAGPKERTHLIWSCVPAEHVFRCRHFFFSRFQLIISIGRSLWIERDTLNAGNRVIGHHALIQKRPV